MAAQSWHSIMKLRNFETKRWHGIKLKSFKTKRWHGMRLRSFKTVIMADTEREREREIDRSCFHGESRERKSFINSDYNHAILRF